MQTVYDWITVAIFAGIAVIFLQRSVGAGKPGDRVIHYLPPSIGCAAANYLGNHDQPVMASALTVATLLYIFLVLKPITLKG